MREIAVESVFKILTSGSISDLIRTLQSVISRYIPLKQTSIGIFSPAGDRLFIAGSTLEEIETASLLDVTRSFDIMELLHDRKPVLLRPFRADSRVSNIQDINEELPPGNILMPMEIDNTVLGMLILYCNGAMSSVNEEVLELVGDIAITATNAVISIHEKDSYQVEQDRLKSEVESLSGDYVATKFFREVFMYNPDGMVVMDMVGRIIRANPASEALLCQDGNLLPDHFIELVEEDQKDTFNALLDGFQQGIYPRNYEVDIVLPTGRRSILAISISLVPQREGNILMTLRDVTQERTIERQLAEAKAFQEKILHSSVDAIMAADLEGTIVLFNEAAATLTGWPAGEVPGTKNVKEFYPRCHAREVMTKLKSYEDGVKVRMEPQI
ncbi:MAG: PAS domain S-box protein [Pseudomonadota bacterium]